MPRKHPKKAKSTRQALRTLELSADGARQVKGGAKPASILGKACATGVHLKEAVITH